MSTWMHRVTYPSTLLHYIGDMILNLLIAAAGVALLMFGIFLFA